MLDALIGTTFALVAISALIYYLSGRQLAHLLGQGRYEAGDARAMALLRRRKRAALALMVLILAAAGLALASEAIRGLEHRQRIASEEGLEVVAGGSIVDGYRQQWSASVDGRILYHLSAEGFVALRTEHWGTTGLFLVDPDGQVVFFAPLGQASRIAYWFDTTDDGVVMDLWVGDRLESYLVPLMNGSWGQPRRLDEPAGADGPLEFTLASHRELPSIEVLAEEGPWRLRGYTTWIRVGSPLASRYSTRVMLDRRVAP